MKSTSIIPPALLIAGLFLSGCDGLDNPSEIVNQPKDFNGAYDFFAEETTDLDHECRLEGSLRLDDGDVEGEATYLNDPRKGEQIIFTGSVDRDGFIRGDFDYPSTGIIGIPADFNGVYDYTATPDKGQLGSCSSVIGPIRLKDGEVENVESVNLVDQNSGEALTVTGFVIANGKIQGDYHQTNDPNANTVTYLGTISSSGNGDGTWFDSFGCLGTWDAKIIIPGSYSGVMSADGSGSGEWTDIFSDCVGTWSAVNQTIRP